MPPIAPPPACGQTTCVSTTTPARANQVMPAVAVDPAGNAYALWSDNRSGDSDVEFAYRPAGGVWAANLRVDDDSGFAEQGMTAIAVDAAGNADALWLDKRTGNWRLLFSQARHQDIAMPMRRYLPLILEDHVSS